MLALATGATLNTSGCKVYYGELINLGSIPGHYVDVMHSADLNGDDTVDAFDLGMVLESWGPCENCPADFGGDGTVNVFDLAVVLANWG